MGLFKSTKAAPATVGTDSFLAPPRDEEFSRRYGLVSDGELPLYFGKVPVALVRPFAPNFSPSEGPEGSRIVAQLASMIRAALSRHESTPPVWVYPGDGCYILSDDYVSHAAYKSLGVEHLPCLIMGEPSVLGPTEVMGPAPVETVDRLTGGR